MALGKLLVGVWIPLSEIRLYRTPVEHHQDLATISHQASADSEKLQTAESISCGKKSMQWVMVWPSKHSLTPGLMLGAAMIARGEIG